MRAERQAPHLPLGPQQQLLAFLVTI